MKSSSSDHRNYGFIQVGAAAGSAEKRSISCSVTSVQGRRLSVCTAEALPVSSAISVQYEDMMFLGEVVTCSGVNGEWNAEIKVDQVLTGLQSLLRLRENLLGEGVPQQIGLVPLAAA